jgi:uncharacterized pyridoxamine 5'-phosphate oxidase family protein
LRPHLLTLLDERGVRRLCFLALYIGMIYRSTAKRAFIFGIGEFKDVYKQLVANPKVEIVACKPDGHWLRYTGKAAFETDPKYAAQALEIMPDLKAIYNEETGNKMACFSLVDATAVDIPMMGPGEDLLA